MTNLGLKVLFCGEEFPAVSGRQLAVAGTRGLHGGIGALASSRKSRLVEHALSTRLVTVHDLVLLDGGPSICS